MTKMMLHGKLLTTNRLLKWGLVIDSSCSLCHNHQESRDYLFVECKFAEKIWTTILYWVNGANFQGTNWESHLQLAIKNAKGRSQTTQIFKMIYVECTNAIWMERNGRVF